MTYSTRRAGIVVLTLGLLLTLGTVACGQDGTPTPTPGPTLPTSQELRQAGDELFSAFSAATRAQDGGAFRELLPKSLRERCTVEEAGGALASGDVLSPDVDVTAVFLDLDNPSAALVRVALREEAEEGLGGLATTLATLFPFPMVREEGGWRLDLLALAGGLDAGEGCPFAEDGVRREEAVAVEARPRSLVPPRGPLREAPNLEPPPGVNMPQAGGSVGVGETTAHALLETDMSLMTLLQFYSEQVLAPGAEVQQEKVADDLAVVTWTFQDDGGFSWFGVLLITPAGEGLRQVRMWIGGGPGP